MNDVTERYEPCVMFMRCNIQCNQIKCQTYPVVKGIKSSQRPARVLVVMFDLCLSAGVLKATRYIVSDGGFYQYVQHDTVGHAPWPTLQA